MQYFSTNRKSAHVSFRDATLKGQPEDKGLYFPEKIPVLTVSFWRDFPGKSPADIAFEIINPFVGNSIDDETLRQICAETVDFDFPLVRVTEHISTLELFHGATLAFKDVGARFMSRCLRHFSKEKSEKTIVIVATSGDTGGAVAAAFHRRPWVDVVVLYPRGLVSPRQEKQLACWGANVRTLAVAGSFDDCQRMVKDAFVDPELARALRLSSANSINVGRLLPQMAYYAVSSLQLYRRDGRKPNYLVPSGNLGNVAACLWARRVGLPIGDVVLATNANLTVSDYLRTGEWRPRPSLATLASAMDVGNPSNMERLRWLFGGVDGVRAQFEAVPVGDDEIRATIRRDHAALAQTWCPHTATAAHVYRQLPPERRQQRWVLVATAHPAKFNEVVEPLISASVPVPAALAELLALPSLQREIEPTLEALREVLMETAA
jgi:threonine synthase